jgi:hypothetical protein
MLTCFSSVIPLSQHDFSYSEQSVYKLVMMRPIERLASLAEKLPKIKPQLETLCEEYTWFLNALAKPSDAAIDWVLNGKNRVDAFKHADRFGDAMFEMTKQVAGESAALRHLII